MSVLRTVGKVLSGLPAGSVAKCFSLVQAAAEREDLSGPEKFQWVYSEMMSAYPEIGTSTLNTLIEMIESSIRKGLES